MTMEVEGREIMVQAAADNHISWFSENAAVANGEVQRHHGAAVIYSPASDSDGLGEVTLAFPQLDTKTAGSAIDAALEVARRTKVRQVSCWSVVPTQPSDLAARLVARGFSWGWEPHWMVLDLETTQPEDFMIPEGLTIELDGGSVWDVTGLPYYEPSDAPRLRALAQHTPRKTYHFGAWRGGKVVGHSLLHVSGGPLNVAGLYNVGVLPEARKQGVGRAISWAACQHARRLGCRYVLLNAATHIYNRLGFVSLGSGQTWWMFRPALELPPLEADTITFIEAIGLGDLGVLETLPVPPDLDATLRCKMTPLEVAARLGQPESARWLLAHGALPDIIPLCDLGWRDQVPAALAVRPELANRLLGAGGWTPLHEAVLRKDLELARLILSARPDLSLQDLQFKATALGWAQHFGYPELAALIQEHLGST
ncbi:GNAT family N-acetyltransferase [Armatimonas sp.]|uniref:GNAT family N-acetyltransferase n=1 Tax=Armatimonas sp. TaxID=1872638 RepID=UPI00286B070D|nr:GNAT family N-acetyltransferase [Armatimonas sp.]